MREGRANKRAVRTTAWSCVAYAGEAFAPAAGTYHAVDTPSLNFTTTNDSGYSSKPSERITSLGAVAPLVLAAMWEAGFALEAGPLSTWSN